MLVEYDVEYQTFLVNILRKKFTYTWILSESKVVTLPHTVTL